jgi:alpha-D-xyloside xylohydrolase
MRPLVMDFVHDARALSVSDQYMFGPSLLVSPVLEPGAKTRSVYLPDGGKDWFDFWKGTRVGQGQVVTADAPLSRIPLHVPAGSILPLGQPRQTTAGHETEIELRIYPGAPGHFELYADEGDTYGYEHGKYSLTRLEWDDARSTLRIGARSGGFPGMPDSVRFRIVKVREGHGAGDSATPTPDAEVFYKGLPVELKIP